MVKFAVYCLKQASTGLKALIRPSKQLSFFLMQLFQILMQLSFFSMLLSFFEMFLECAVNECILMPKKFAPILKLFLHNPKLLCFITKIHHFFLMLLMQVVKLLSFFLKLLSHFKMLLSFFPMLLSFFEMFLGIILRFSGFFPKIWETSEKNIKINF